MSVRAKICGIRSEADLRVAVDSGADALGFICGITHVSEDVLEPSDAAKLIAEVPPMIGTVLVTHMVESDVILDLASVTGVDTVQIHGQVPHEVTREVWSRREHRRIIKAIHVVDESAIAEAVRHAPYCDAVLLDSRTADRLGGTGRVHNWAISRRVADEMRRLGKPTIVAGGLNRYNVADVIDAVLPYAVDVNSGVEEVNGDKSADECGAFVSIAHSVGPIKQLQTHAR